MKRDKTKEWLCYQIRALSITIYIGCIMLIMEMIHPTGRTYGIWFLYMFVDYILSNISIALIIAIAPLHYNIKNGLKSLLISLGLSFLIFKGTHIKWEKITDNPL